MIELEARVPGKLYFLMTKPPGPDGEFVEVEDAAGAGVGLGRWVKLGPLFALEFDDPRATP